MPVIDIHHFNLRAHRPLLDELRDFYVSVTGLTIGDRPPFERFGYRLYANDKAIVHLTEAGPEEGRSAVQHGTLDHVALSCQMPERFIRVLSDRGIPYRLTQVPIADELQIFFKDPAGNSVELFFPSGRVVKDTTQDAKILSTLTKPLHVRKLTKADAERFHALRLAALQDSPSAYGASYEEESAFSPEQIESRLADRADRGVFGAFNGDELVGLVALGRETMQKLQHKGMLFGMYVMPQFRGKGVGRVLVDAAVRLAESVPGLQQLKLSVNASNLSAIALYKACGFQVYGREAGALLHEGTLHDELHMSKHLSGLGPIAIPLGD